MKRFRWKTISCFRTNVPQDPFLTCFTLVEENEEIQDLTPSPLRRLWGQGTGLKSPGHLSKNNTICSCWMCGNPRKDLWEATVQEKKFHEHYGFLQDALEVKNDPPYYVGRINSRCATVIGRFRPNEGGISIANRRFWAITPFLLAVSTLQC